MNPAASPAQNRPAFLQILQYEIQEIKFDLKGLLRIFQFAEIYRYIQVLSNHRSLTQ